MGKVVKKTFGVVVKPFKKIVKKTIKRVKKLAGKVMKGFGKIYAKTFGKLGPLGSIALSFVLPGLGSMLGGMWTSAATSLHAQGGLLGAIGSGMKAIGAAASTVSGAIGKVTGGITDKISGVFKQVGGTITDGANNLFKSAQKFFNVEKPLSFSELGDKVAQGAKDLFKASPSPTGTGTPVPVVDKSISALTPSVPPLGGNGPLLPGAAPLPTPEPSLFPGVESMIGPEQGTFPLQSTVAEQAALQQQQAQVFASSVPGVLPKSIPVVEKSVRAAKPAGDVKKSSSLLSKAGSALLDSFLGAGLGVDGQQQEAQFPTSSADFNTLDIQRGLLGGQGAGGGFFLSPEMLAFFEQERRRLGELG